MQVLVDNFGMSLGKKSERLVVKEKGAVIAETPFRDIRQITITTSGVSISTDVIRECTEYGIQIHFLTPSGKPYANLSSPNLTGTVATRREQILAYLDERGVDLSKAFIEGKIKNQAAVLKYFAKYRRSSNLDMYNRIYEGISSLEKNRQELDSIHGPSIDSVRGQLMSVEGRAANHYWETIKVLLAERADFPGREHRGAADPVNSLLNYGYGILYTQVWGAVVLAGLEPFAGFLHTDRPGKPSLVLDLVEEFRPQVVDRTVVALINRGTEVSLADGRLEDGTRREFASRVLERLDSEESLEGKKYRLKTIIQRQARRLAACLRGEGRYKPYVGSW